ncbi:MAG TPA: MOSC N-terminal beta barrel domain-containing protein [Opitutaceae bacterium]
MHLASLHIHPVKSLRGLSVTSAEVDALGAVGDRRFLVVDPDGNFLTQRTVSRMAQVDALIDETRLTLCASGRADLQVRRQPDPGAPLFTVRVWNDPGLRAEDCGLHAREWLSAVLQTPCRLVRIGDDFIRPVKPGAARPGDVVSFADGYPFLVTSEASVGDLNQRIGDNGGDPVPMGRFRANLVVSGCEAYAEDTWKRISIGDVEFRSTGPCARCIITTTDQLTGERGKEPLRTLAGYRRDPGEPSQVLFGQNLVNVSKAGRIRVGDPVRVIE